MVWIEFCCCCYEMYQVKVRKPHFCQFLGY
jgi:hypothetical protein